MRAQGRKFVVFALLVLLGWPLSAAAATGNKFSVGIGLDYATGDYGTDKTTDSWAVPFVVDYYPTKELDFELVIPYIHQSNSNTIYANGMRYSMRRTSMMQRPSFNLNESQSGLGDMTLTMGYALLPETQTRPLVRPVLYLQFPTGDENKGLGTGEFAAGPGLGFSKWINNWNVFGEGRYIFQGSNSDIGLKDYGTLEGEVGYLVGSNFFPSFDLWYASAPADDSSDMVVAKLKAKYRISEEWHAEGYLATGLTNSTADFGLGASIFYSF
jgi:hypothetical protein